MTDLSPMEQFQALNVLDILRDLITGSTKETFSRAEVLVIINLVATHPDLFDPDIVVAQQVATAHIL